MKTRVWLGNIAVAVVLIVSGTSSQAQEPTHRNAYVHVVVGDELPGPVSGRLLVFAKKARTANSDPAEDGKKKVDINEFHPTDTSVAAVEVHDLAPGSAVEVDLDRVAYPAALLGHAARRL